MFLLLELANQICSLEMPTSKPSWSFLQLSGSVFMISQRVSYTLKWFERMSENPPADQLNVSGISVVWSAVPAGWTRRSAPGRTWSIWGPGSPRLPCSPTAASSGSRWGRSPWPRPAPGNLERHSSPSAHVGYNRLVSLWHFEMLLPLTVTQGFYILC